MMPMKNKKKVLTKKKKIKRKKVRLTTKEKAEEKEKKLQAKKKRKREKIGNYAFEEYDRQDREREQMFAADKRSISLDEFVDVALITAGQSPEGHSLDGSGMGVPKRRQVVFVWGFGDARLGLGQEACKWYGMPGRDPKLRHQLVPILCRPLSDGMDSPIESVSLGETHGLAVTRNRCVYVWGQNGYCQLGLRDNKERPDPEEMVFLEGCVDIQASRYYSMALMHTGELYTWGQGRDGVLGHGETMSRCCPHLVTSLSGRRVQQIVAGPSHAMVITSRAPTFGTTRPEKRIRYHKRVRGVERWNLDTNIAASLRNRDDLTYRAARFVVPRVRFEFPPPSSVDKKIGDKIGGNKIGNKIDGDKITITKAEGESSPAAGESAVVSSEVAAANKDGDATKEAAQEKEKGPLVVVPHSPLSPISPPRRLAPLHNQVSTFGAAGQRNVYPLDVENAHGGRKQMRPLFNDQALWRLTNGRDGERDIAMWTDRERKEIEVQWRAHRDESFRERKKRKSATLTIQCLARRFKVRQWMFEVLRRKSAATMLQRRQRGIRGRKIALRKRQVRAAILVQKRMRGKISRNRNGGKIQEAKSAGRQKVTEKYAAIMVQKRIRGKISRKSSQKLMARKRKQDKKDAKKRRQAAKAAAEVARLLALRNESLVKARKLYDPTNEMDDDELIEIAQAMGGEWNF